MSPSAMRLPNRFRTRSTKSAYSEVSTSFLRRFGVKDGLTVGFGRVASLGTLVQDGFMSAEPMFETEYRELLAAKVRRAVEDALDPISEDDVAAAHRAWRQAKDNLSRVRRRLRDKMDGVQFLKSDRGLAELGLLGYTPEQLRKLLRRRDGTKEA